MSNAAADKTFALFDSFTNKKIISEINERGLEMILFPPVSAKKIASNSHSVDLLNELKRFDWVIFTDVLAVDLFLETLVENDIDFFELDDARVCAFGENVSDRLRFVQLHADVIPINVETPCVIESIKNYSSDKELDELKFLIVREKLLNLEIGIALKDLNAEVVDFPVYEIELQAKSEIVRLKTLLKNGAADEFVFSAPEDLIALQYIFDEEPLSEILREMEISAADQLVWQALKENGIKNAGLFRLGNIAKV